MPKLFKEKRDCCGCTACMSICPTAAISMRSDEEGFKYPFVDEALCMDCGLCLKVCAFKRRSNEKESQEMPFVYAAKHRNEYVRMQSSSGGMFTALSDHILNKNGAVYGAAYDEDIVCRHIRATTKEESALCRGSKYVQSDIQETFKLIKKDLNDEKKVLFTGTPCQVDGLNAFLGKESNIENLLTVDFICHGVPSPKVFAEYIKHHEEGSKKKIVEYYNRCKDKGWGHTEKVVYEDGSFDHTSMLSQSWKYLFYANVTLRPSCYRCPYTQVKRCSDITIADFWGADKSIPEFSDEKGISLILVNTEKGKEYLNMLHSDMLFLESDINTCISMQGNLRRPTIVDSKKRKQFWVDYHTKGISYVLKRYGRNNTYGRIKRYFTDKDRWFAHLVEHLFQVKKQFKRGRSI